MTDGGVNLPEEIVSEILSRLCVKSLCRFKCVSHSWLTLISDPKFAKTHLIRSRNNNYPPPHRERIILAGSTCCLYSVDYDDDVPVATKLDFPSAAADFCDYPAFICGSCNGLLLIVHRYNSRFLVNPSTRNYNKLPNCPFVLGPFWSDVLGFGYDLSTDDYKVVVLTYYGNESDSTIISKALVSVYSLKTNLWRRIQDYPKMIDFTIGVYVNGCLHWLASISCNYPAVIAFDLADENFREVSPPKVYNNDEVLAYKLAVVGGCLCYLVVYTSGIQNDIWIMEEYGVRESWTKFTSNIPENYGFYLLHNSSLSGEGEFLLAMDKEKMVLYNPKEETLRDVVICGFSTLCTCFGTYVDSLVSPNSNQ